MAYLSLICLTLIAQTGGQAVAAKPAPADTWKAVKTPVGVTLSAPVDLGKPEESTDKDPKSTTESYSPEAWPDCELFAEREDFPSDEDPKDPLADRIGGALLGEIDLDSDKVNRISYGTQEGWPTMDIEGKFKNGDPYWYRMSRSKTQHFVIGFSGKNLPSRAIMKKVLDSYKLPTEAGVGKVSKWWPEPKWNDLPDAHLSVWSPLELKSADDTPDFTMDTGKSLGYSGEFGYCLYNVSCTEYPGNIGDQLDDEAIDNLIKASFSDATDIKFGEFKTIQNADLKFRSGTFVDGTNDGRMDVLVHDNHLFMFYAAGPRGMLDSDDMKKFFSSIVIK